MGIKNTHLIKGAANHKIIFVFISNSACKMHEIFPAVVLQWGFFFAGAAFAK